MPTIPTDTAITADEHHQRETAWPTCRPWTQDEIRRRNDTDPATPEVHDLGFTIKEKRK